MAKQQPNGWPEDGEIIIHNLPFVVKNRIIYNRVGTEKPILIRVGKTNVIQIRNTSIWNSKRETILKRWAEKRKLNYMDARDFTLDIDPKNNSAENLLEQEKEALQIFLTTNQLFAFNRQTGIGLEPTAMQFLAFWLADHPHGNRLVEPNKTLLESRLHIEETAIMRALSLRDQIAVIEKWNQEKLKRMQQLWRQFLPGYKPMVATLAYQL